MTYSLIVLDEFQCISVRETGPHKTIYWDRYLGTGILEIKCSDSTHGIHVLKYGCDVGWSRVCEFTPYLGTGILRPVSWDRYHDILGPVYWDCCCSMVVISVGFVFVSSHHLLKRRKCKHVKVIFNHCKYTLTAKKT
jgi:hypothetical protein